MNHEYTGFSDDVMSLYLPELDDDAAMEAAWAEWCAQNPTGDDGEMF
jgi:hypothetical protein